jgi:uncharacterized protein (DUF4213/DUF364 family)
MEILTEAAQLVQENLDGAFHTLTIERLVVGLFFTGVKLSNGAGGVCFTPIKEIPHAVCCPSSAGRAFDPVKTQGMKAKDLLKALSSEEPIKKAVAIATLNALSVSCWELGITGNYTIEMNKDAQDAIMMPIETSVAVVGAFVPILKTLTQRGGKWWVIEQDSKTLKGEEIKHYVPAKESEEIIKRANVLIITGVTLANNTLKSILSLARPETEIAVIGPTAGLLPEPLFKRGVSLIGGVWVKKPNELLDVLSAGGSGYHFFDKLADRIVIKKRE